MLWPSRSNYTQAIGSYPHISILDPKLKGGHPRRDSNNSLIVYSGGFSTVFPVEMLSNIYALRCWIADIGDAETRYKEISDYLKQCRLPYFVDFAYVPNGIMVNGVKYPVTRMEWAEGKTLRDFIEQNLQDARVLKTAAAAFQKMVAALHTHQISHGDLQDGNILLKRSGTDVEIKLIDYDSVFVPALRGHPDTIVGLSEYQHPQRIAGGEGANEKVDYFSELVIYISLLSLAEKPNLWNQFGNRTEKGLLFTDEDFKNSDQSDVFRELENLSLDVKHLASKLKHFCRLNSIVQLTPLEGILPKPDVAASSNQGWTHLKSKQHNQAIAEFQKAITIDPNYKDVHRGLGLAYLRSEQYDQAIAEFQKEIFINPNHKEARHGLGLAYFQIGNLREAKRETQEVLRIDANYQPTLEFLESQNKNMTLWEQWNRVPQKDDKQDKRSPSNLGAAPPKWLYSTDYECAKANNCGLIAFHKSWYDIHRNWHDIAIQLFKKVIKIDRKIAVAYYNLGCTYLAMKEYTKAAISLGKAASCDPNLREVRYNLALTYLGKGYCQAAISEVVEALNIDKNYRPARQLSDYLDRLMGDE